WLLLRGDIDGSADAFTRCLSAVPSSGACLSSRALLYEQIGRCDEMEADARANEALGPNDRAIDLVARAGAAKGAAESAIEETLAGKWTAVLRDDVRDMYRLNDRAHLAELRGDFVEAERLLREVLAKHVGHSPEENDHEAGLTPILLLEMEMGRTQD